MSKEGWLATRRTGSIHVARDSGSNCASALPVIAFGEQLSCETDGSLSTSETLASTAICGVIHSIFGGQPLLICCRPDYYNVRLLIQFCQPQCRKGTVFSLGRVGLCVDCIDAVYSRNIQCMYNNNSIHKGSGGIIWHANHRSFHSRSHQGCGQ
ncbi:hypothetical protein ABFS82_01G030000 [Erythranthe guttata]|uniref:probable boron transporter 6 n=1 Tax=Erythranthe guttata TaxID=4155 RepID=UPI00064D9A58|nr:PREDICTED: probable boron transporter 6 [Erythranthe guttata]|eukprot:XP_012855906.1 PREDICTED: probable boron transporter 6 [Erythranthe guttata]